MTISVNTTGNSSICNAFLTDFLRRIGGVFFAGGYNPLTDISMSVRGFFFPYWSKVVKGGRNWWLAN